MSDGQRELLKGNTESLLLSLIQAEPMYGYQIIKEIERRSEGYFRFREGTLYPALHRLEKDVLVEGRWQQTPRGQDRRYYYLTAKGQAVREAKMAEWQGFSTAVNRVISPRPA